LLLTPVVRPVTSQLATPSEVTSFSYWSIKAWFLTGKNLLLCSSYLSLGVPNGVQSALIKVVERFSSSGAPIPAAIARGELKQRWRNVGGCRFTCLPAGGRRCQGREAARRRESTSSTKRSTGRRSVGVRRREVVTARAGSPPARGCKASESIGGKLLVRARESATARLRSGMRWI
jgi:hypothetical protein